MKNVIIVVNDLALEVYNLEKKVLDKLTYGLFVLTACQNGMQSGCIINTAEQVAYNPDMICIAVNKNNHTHDMILATGVFNVSVISEDADFGLFQRFGFVSGRDVDKFADFEDWQKAENGVAYITKGTNAYISAKVEKYISLDSHTVFIARVEKTGHISDIPSATYAYYHENIKVTAPKKEQDAEPSEEGQGLWRCIICGYEYVGEELPEDFICPVCKHPASDFEKVK